MSAHSKKEAEDMYGMFGDLSALASDDTGEINSFASDVINREVSANKLTDLFSDLFSAVGRKLGDGWTSLRHLGDRDAQEAARLMKQEKYLGKMVDARDVNKYHRTLAHPDIFRVFDADIEAQAKLIVQKAILEARNLPKDTLAKAQKSLRESEGLQRKAQAKLDAANNLVKSLQNSTDVAAKKAADAEHIKASQTFAFYENQAKASKAQFDEVRRQYDNPQAIAQANAIADEMEKYRGDYIQSVRNEVASAVKKEGNVVNDTKNLIVSVNKPVGVQGKNLPKIDVEKINLDNTKYESTIGKIKLDKEDIAKNRAEIETRINARPVPKQGDTKVVNGKKWYFNGKTWLLIGAAGTLLLGKDKLQGAYESMGKGNHEVNVGPQTTSPESATESPNSSSGYDAGAAHETSPGVMNNLNPGGPNTTQAPKAYGQDAWDKFKSTPPTQRRRFESDSDYDNGWWNAPTTSKPTYDDMGYIGGSDESWSRTAQKSTPSVDELDDSALSDYGADKVLAAQNFLSYYGLGTDKQPGKQIIESLLMGNFDGKSFDEYKSTHSEDEVRHAMKRFEQGLSMFSTEMGKLANSLESFYQERQRRIESEKSKPVQPNEQPNEQPERTE